jgi:Fe-S-cluster containining protein
MPSYTEIFKDIPTSDVNKMTKEYLTEMSKFYHISELSKLTSLFKCPPSCTHCCKTLRPNVTYFDVRNIELQNPSVIPKVTALRVGKDTRISLDSPCIFLKDNCSIYPDRPFVCQTYPFVFRDSIPDHIQLMPCPLGIQIINHIMPTVISEYTKILHLNTSSQSTIDNFVSATNQLQEKLNSYHESGKFFHEKYGSRIICLQFQKSIISSLVPKT